MVMFYEILLWKLKDENLNHYNIKNGKNLDRLTNDYIFRYYHYKRLHGS